jgi:hypothetical protein
MMYFFYMLICLACVYMLIKIFFYNVDAFVFK